MFLLLSTIWGVCSSLDRQLRSSLEIGFDTVLIRFPFHVVPNNATIIPAKDPKDRFLVIATASFLSRSAALPLSASYSMVASKIASCSQDAYNRHIWAGSWK
jgi:hypothetical protein